MYKIQSSSLHVFPPSLSQAAQIIEDATAMYLAGDRMSAIRRYEQALLKDPTVEQRQECLYASTCVHASFGDLELAKMTLRDAIVAGLDWDSAVMRTDYVPFTASTQVKIQLRAFAEMVVKQMAQQQRQSATGCVADRALIPCSFTLTSSYLLYSFRTGH